MGETHFVFVFVRVAPQVACRQTSHTEIATSPLHSLFCAQSAGRRSRCIIQMSEGGFCRSAAPKDCWLVEAYFLDVFLCFVVGSVSGCFFLCLFAAVDGARGMGTFREGGRMPSIKWRRAAKIEERGRPLEPALSKAISRLDLI